MLLALLTCLPLAPAAGAKTQGTESTLAGTLIYGLTVTNRLVSFSTTSTNTLLSDVKITGTLIGETIIAIDFRPATQQLYGLGSLSRLYTIDPATGVATVVSTTPFSPQLFGNEFGFDFNPTVDRIRIVSDFQQNLRLNPVTGAVVATDPAPFYAAGDANAGVVPTLTGAAYTNNFAGATTTTLYVIDPNRDVLAKLDPATASLMTIGALGINVLDTVGFDIATSGGKAYASFEVVGLNFSRLYTIDLGTGMATEAGTIGGNAAIRDIAVAMGVPTSAADTVGLFAPTTATWYLRNANTTGFADLTFIYTGGVSTSMDRVPVAGDYDGNGTATVGVYNKATSTFFLRNSNTAGSPTVVATFGSAGTSYVPLIGDWDGNGTETIGLYNPTTGIFYLRNANTSGTASVTFTYGLAGMGWVPIVGDWDGNGTDTVGLYNPATGVFYLRNSNSTGIADITLTFGPAGLNWVPLAGDWNGDTVDTVGVYDPAGGAFYLKNSNTSGIADIAFTFGPAGMGWVPLAGNWDGL